MKIFPTGLMATCTRRCCITSST